MAEPKLNLLFPETHDAKSLLIADISLYPVPYSIVNPTIEITVPGFNVVTLAFTAQGFTVYNSMSLQITCSDLDCETIDLPDGIYNVKYSITPAYRYFVNKSFLRVNKLQEKFDKVYLKLDFMQCDQAIKQEDFELLNTIQTYINGAIAAANNCLDTLAMKLYGKASEAIDDFVNHRCYLK